LGPHVVQVVIFDSIFFTIPENVSEQNDELAILWGMANNLAGKYMRICGFSPFQSLYQQL